MKPKTDPLLAALIAMLPPTGADWPVDKQLSWLRLVAIAFGAVYGGDAAAQMDGSRTEPPKVASIAPAPPPAPKPAPTYAFIIDEEGYVRKGTGQRQRVLQREVPNTAAVYDLRGMDGDMKTIIWADGSTGLNGADLTISVG